MEFRNRDGVAVDPVPFVVTGGAAALLLYSFVPGYLLALGFRLDDALGVTTAASATAFLVAYHRFVHAADPRRRILVPASLRFRRIVYGMLLVVATIALLSLPLLAP
jgi:hypothetical protein